MNINSLNSVADACQHLVWNGAKGIAEHSDRQVVAKDFHLVTLLAVDVGHVNHADIHADVTHIVGFLPIHQTIAATIAEMTIEAVGIANRNGSNAAVTFQDGATRITNAVPLRHITNL